MKRQFWGIVLVILGSLALLQALGIQEFGLSFWPVVATLFGLSVIYSSVISGRGPQWFSLALGLWVGSWGVLEMASDAGIVTGIDGSAILSAGWPILLIAIGISIITGRDGFFRFSFHGRPRRRRSDGRHQVIGDLHYGRGHWVLDKDLDLSNTVGDLKVDLTTADITPGVHRITLVQFIGETQIKVPDDVTVRVTVEANVGEVDVLGESRSGTGLYLTREVIVPDSPAELIIEAQLRVGSLRIIRLPSANPRVF